MTARERADTSTRQADLFAELLAEVVVSERGARQVVAKLERESNTLWVTRLLGKRCAVRTLEIAASDLKNIALAYGAQVVWNGTSSEKT
jgi:hypothetical protein